MNKRLFFACSIAMTACDPQQHNIDPPPQPERITVAPPSETWARLRPVYWTADDGSKFNAPWWWWANPAHAALPDYAQDVYGILRDRDIATPHTWRPLYDSKIGGLCLFYPTADGRVRCLPGWAQQRPEDQVDGFYAEPTCNDWRKWLYVLPASEVDGNFPQRFLVVAGTENDQTATPYEAASYAGRVYQRRLAGPVRICEEYRGTALRFFTAGRARSLDEFVALGETTIDMVP